MVIILPDKWLDLTENTLCEFDCLDARICLRLNFHVQCAACFRQLSHVGAPCHGLYKLFFKELWEIAKLPTSPFRLGGGETQS